MKFLFAVATSLVALFSSTTVAVIQSKPFFLEIHSTNSTLNGKTFEACHEGAGIEGLCVSSPLAKANPKFNTFQFNYTKSQPNIGLITYELIGGNFNGMFPSYLSG